MGLHEGRQSGTAQSGPTAYMDAPGRSFTDTAVSLLITALTWHSAAANAVRKKRSRRIVKMRTLRIANWGKTTKDARSGRAPPLSTSDAEPTFMNKALTATAILAATGFGAAAQAHQIWLEQPAGQNAVIRFGEFGENLR